MKHLTVDDEIVSLEAIDRQSSLFFNEFAMEIGILKNKLKENNKLPVKEWQSLAKVVKKYTNLTVEFTNHDSKNIKDMLMELYILPEVIHPNHPFIEDWYKPLEVKGRNEKIVYDKPEGIRGKIDLKKGMVDGDFSKLTSYINLPGSLLYKDVMTVEQVTAIMLHEIGHQFTYFAALDKLVAVNQVLIQLMGNLTKTSDNKEKTMLLMKASKDMGHKPDIKAIEEIVSKGKKETILQLFLVNRANDTRNMTSSSTYYDLTQAEQSADQYVARLGGAVYLAESLEVIAKYWKIDVYQKNKEEFKKAELIRQISNIITQITAPGKILMFVSAIAGIISGNIFFGIPMLLLSIATHIIDNIAFSVVAGSGVAHYRYDTPRDRVSRIRNDLINQLKDKDKGSDYYKNILIEIDSLTKILEKYYPEDSVLVSKYVGKYAYDTVQFQKDLEALAANDLFVHAANFKYN